MAHKCEICGSELILRSRLSGTNEGHRYWVCSRYPECKYFEYYAEQGNRGPWKWFLEKGKFTRSQDSQKRGRSLSGNNASRIAGFILLFLAVLVFFIFQDMLTPHVKTALQQGNVPQQSPRLISPEQANEIIALSKKQATESAQQIAPIESNQTPEAVFRSVSPSVVVIRANERQGSGVVVGQGMVVTNRHVVQGSGQCYVVIGGQRLPASVHYADPDNDLCALYVPGLNAPAVKIVSYKTLRVGQRVYAVGAPQGLDLTISDGLVSGIRINGGMFPIIQTNTPISPGSSGGGLFDTSGQLIGITTASLLGGQQLNIALVADLIPLLPSRSVNIAQLGPATNPTTAKELTDKPWLDRLAKAKEEMNQREADWRSCTSTANALVANLNALQAQMNNLRAVRRTAEYNVLVPEHNRQAENIRAMNIECNEKHSSYVSQVNFHNDIVRQYNNR